MQLLKLRLPLPPRLRLPLPLRPRPLLPLRLRPPPRLRLRMRLMKLMLRPKRMTTTMKLMSRPRLRPKSLTTMTTAATMSRSPLISTSMLQAVPLLPLPLEEMKPKKTLLLRQVLRPMLRQVMRPMLRPVLKTVLKRALKMALPKKVPRSPRMSNSQVRLPSLVPHGPSTLRLPWLKVSSMVMHLPHSPPETRLS